MITITVDGTRHELDVDPSMPLLWVLRDVLANTGPKFGCGQALCGACTVHVNGAATRACVLPVSAAQGKAITTIHGVEGPVADAVLAAWDQVDVVQCGYCQPGQVMSACALLAVNRAPSDGEIDTALRGNLCRCGAYQRIRAAIHAAAERLTGPGAGSGSGSVRGTAG
ncbi:MAG: (2Fe-2S)-binding protein [Gemmatimonadaceae bacterium]|jgi:aerobic-type carbon monoxide dehydrogenase small subunit (CoxS/CutS family)|nr:(2Fe-2S)-binding protein [Gemmatimonadaceae bacterium]